HIGWSSSPHNSMLGLGPFVQKVQRHDCQVWCKEHQAVQVEDRCQKVCWLQSIEVNGVLPSKVWTSIGQALPTIHPHTSSLLGSCGGEQLELWHRSLRILAVA
ncbi:unnamed protein product, partial [Durusdinium trenchii]